jgi:hypothetical protein
MDVLSDAFCVILLTYLGLSEGHFCCPKYVVQNAHYDNCTHNLTSLNSFQRKMICVFYSGHSSFTDREQINTLDVSFYEILHVKPIGPHTYYMHM